MSRDTSTVITPTIATLTLALDTAQSRYNEAEAADNANPYKHSSYCSQEAGRAFRALLTAKVALEEAKEEEEERQAAENKQERIQALEQLVADFAGYITELDAQYGYKIKGAAERFTLLQRAREVLRRAS